MQYCLSSEHTVFGELKTVTNVTTEMSKNEIHYTHIPPLGGGTH